MTNLKDWSQYSRQSNGFVMTIIELPYNKNKAKAKFWGKTEIGKVYKSWFSQKIYLDKLIRKKYNQKR